MPAPNDRLTADTNGTPRKRLLHSPSFRWRGAIGALVFLPAFLLVSFSTGVVEEGTVLDWLVDSLGWSFLVLYVTCRIWATLFVGDRKDQIMQTQGIYSLTRNPLYFGSTCFALSACMFFQSPFLLLLTLFVFAFYLLKVIRSEEAVLRNRFGLAFDEYTLRTPRFFPRFSNYQTPERVTVSVPALRREARRLWAGTMLIPIAGTLLETLRSNPHWPHVFRLL